jgi:hypothetical protein
MGGEEALPSPADLADLRGCCGTGVLKGRLRRSRGREIIWGVLPDHLGQAGRVDARPPASL